MSNNNMNSMAYRRELRKKKILENAELRKQKIFGITKDEENNRNSSCDLLQQILKTSDEFCKADIGITGEKGETNSVKEDKDETSSTKSFESQRSSKSQPQDEELLASPEDINLLNDILRNIPDPIFEYQTENNLYEATEDNFQEPVAYLSEEEPTTHFTHNTSADYASSSASYPSRNGSSLLTNSNERSFTSSSPCLLFDILGHPGCPVFLAIIVCFLICMNLGNLVSNSIIIPFCLWEIQQFVASYGIMESKEEHTIIEAALLLSGVQKNVIGKYIWLTKLLRDIYIDFSLYFVTIVLWQILIGLPTYVPEV